MYARTPAGSIRCPSINGCSTTNAALINRASGSTSSGAATRMCVAFSNPGDLPLCLMETPEFYLGSREGHKNGQTFGTIRKMKHLRPQTRWPSLIAALAAPLVLMAAASMTQTHAGNTAAWQDFLKELVAAAEDRTHHTVRYDPAYVRIPYPGGEVPHIGMVIDEKSPEGRRHLVVHNIGQGPQMEDVLFAWKITGHYRYYGPAF